MSENVSLKTDEEQKFEEFKKATILILNQDGELLYMARFVKFFEMVKESVRKQ